MPGAQGYGPGGKWIHDRAHRIMQESEGTPKSMAYAIATQQAHKVGKSPKGFRTSEGVSTAKAKFDRPKKEYQKTAMWAGFFDEMAQIEKDAGWLKSGLVGLGMMGALAGGGKALGTKAVAAGMRGAPAITQAAKGAGLAKTFRGGLGGATQQAGQLRSMGVLP